nr:MAG TPA: hypothetical protein [Bacteriophage sp.]
MPYLQAIACAPFAAISLISMHCYLRDFFFCQL